MARPNLAKLAAQQAHAEYGPQIRGVRRGTRSQIRSIRSEQPALEGSLQSSARQLRHAGLSPKDLAIALSEIAHRTADVGASTALQAQQARQEGHGQIVDLLNAEGQAQRSALSQLQQDQAEHTQDLQDERGAEMRQFKMDILKEQALKAMELGSYADNGSGGLTPTQRRDAAQSHHNAAFYAKQLFTAAKDGVTDPKTGEVVIPAGPHNWDDQIWNQMVEKIAGEKGVDTVADAQRAVQAIRAHIQPDSTAGSLLHSLGTVAAAAAPIVAPKPLKPIAQFASALLR